MLRVSQPQLTLWDAVLPAELTTLNEELRKVDEFLDNSEFVQPFKEHFNERIGRPGTPIDTFIRLMYLKHRYGLGYELLVEQVKDSIMWRRFCHIPIDGKVPDSTTLIKLVKRCNDTAIKELNELVIKQAVAKQLIRARKLRTDTTVVEANIHYPTDASLIHDGIGVVSKMVKKVKALGAATAVRYNNHSRSARKKLLSIVKVLRRRTKEAVKEVREITGQMADIADHTLKMAQSVLAAASEQLEQASEATAEKATSAINGLRDTVQHLRKAVDQARKVNDGQTHIADRLVSVHDPDARPISKGKLRASTEFGYKLSLGESEERVITAYQIMTGNPSDESLLEQCLDEHTALVGKPPRVVAADRGYSSRKAEKMLAEKGVKYASIPRRGKVGWQRDIYQRQWWFSHYQKWRAGVEATISVLKRRFGLGRSLSRGHQGTSCWVGYGVLAYNLRRLATM
jgi:IS5 family transposase